MLPEAQPRKWLDPGCAKPMRRASPYSSPSTTPAWFESQVTSLKLNVKLWCDVRIRPLIIDLLTLFF